MARSKRKKNTNTNLYIKITCLALILMCLFGIFKWGVVGEWAYNIISLLFGGMSIPIAIIIIVFSVWYIFTSEVLFIKEPKRLVGGGVTLISVMTLLHAWFFNNIINPETHVFQSTWRFAMAEFQSSGVNQDIGGGLVGATTYGLSYILFEQIGTYIVWIILLLIGVLLMLNIPFSIFLGTIYGWVESLVNKIRQSFGEQKVKKEKKKTKPDPEKSPKAEIKSEAVANQPPVVEKSDIKPPVVERPPKEEIEEDDNQPEQMTFEEFDDNEDYELPSINLLDSYKPADQSNELDLIDYNKQKLQDTFESFGVEAEVVEVTLGPAVTKYAIKPATGVKVSKIVGLQNDIALALAAKDIRIEAPIPGQALIGIEVPNQDVSFVPFKEVMERTSRNPNKLLEIPLGKDINGEVISADLSKMPHLLIAGATGSGKSVAINGIITALLMRTKPNEVKLMLVDPKKVELNVYNGIPHLLTPVVTNPKKAARALNNVVKEMERRYELFASTGSRNRDGYNQYVIKHNQETGENLPRLPYIVVVVDELADLMMVASKEVEDAIMRLAQMARAAGIHMVLATQRPSVDVLTGTIKANIPSRMAFSVSSGTDSRTILDMTGAEKLIGKGDMLYLPMGQNQPTRVQGSFISDAEVEHIVDFVKDQQDANYVEEMIPSDKPESSVTDEPEDELFDDVVEFIIQEEKCSISLLQRHFRIGYNRAARIVDELEDRGYIGPQNGSKPREVYIKAEAVNEEQAEIVQEDAANHDQE